MLLVAAEEVQMLPPRPSRTWCVRTTLCPRTFVAGGEVGLAMGLEVGGDVGGAQHLSTDAAGHLPLVSDHVGAQSVFGSEGRGTGLRGRIGARGLEGEHWFRGTCWFIRTRRFRLQRDWTAWFRVTAWFIGRARFRVTSWFMGRAWFIGRAWFRGSWIRGTS